MAPSTGDDVLDAKFMNQFYGLLVEVVDMEGEMVKRVPATDLDDSDSDFGSDEVEAEHQRGRVVDWREDTQTYTVETFNGVLLAIPENNLREWSPPPSEDGGFDLMWPGAYATNEFGEIISQNLATKGFCVVQTSLSRRVRDQAIESAEGEDGMRPFSRFPQEIEAAYLGFDNHTKIATLDNDESAYPEEGVDALENCNRMASTAALLLSPFSATLGFSCASLQKSMVRMSIDTMDEDEMFPEALADLMEEEGGDWVTHVHEYVRFAQCRRACVLFMVDNDGGDVWLYPKASVDGQKMSVHIPMAPNKMLIFRHDQMDYSYQPRGRSLAVQTWMLEDLKNSQQIKEVSLCLPIPGQSGQVVVNPGPQVPDGPKANIMALSTRMPGEAWNASQYWMMFASGTDACTRWPIARWDYEPYYEEGTDSNQTGKSYTCHGGFVSQEQITQFDNDFFGISYGEAVTMVPGQKMSLEVGYSCLAGAGLTRKTLKGRRIGLWYGDVGPDWGSFQTLWGLFCPTACPTTMATSMSNASTSARLSHVFDLKGPISSYDTACSASLVAMNAAHLLMFNGDQKGDDKEALVTGVNTLLGPGSFIGNCMATMLSHVGRCFTFNRAADGYQRGEGCASIFLRLAQGDRDEEDNRVCVLIGTATNQDGRSASLTAPNGPAQQAVIQKSMKFAGINPNTVSIAECHGTGTALGDPIEVGALVAVMRNREFPICKTSAKSNIAHLEAGAGVAGLTKCIMMINMATAPPNCHFNVINGHLMVEDYPVIFDTECINTDFSSLYCGVSSFGFGGTNSRADVYGYASKGHKASIRVELPRLCPPRAVPMGQTLYVSGTWNNFETFDRMQGGRNAAYTCDVVLGPSRVEEFQISCDQRGQEVFHPLIPNAGQNCQVVGPDWEGEGLNFIIDGVKDGAQPGTVYRIVFDWQDCRKSISWSPSLRAVTDAEAGDDDAGLIGTGYEHRYYIAGSWKAFRLEEMSKKGDGLFEAKFKVGPANQECFQIVRNRSLRHVFHPCVGSGSRPTDLSVPLAGPDDQGTDDEENRRCWCVAGAMHGDFTVRLRMEGVQTGVEVIPPGGAPVRSWWDWETWATRGDNVFFAMGSFNGGGLTSLTEDANRPGVSHCQVELDSEGFASLQIVVNTKANILCPDSAGELRLYAGQPDERNAWFITGVPRSRQEVKLDLKSRRLTWTDATPAICAY